MKVLLIFLAIFVILHTCNSYIVLSANMEDIHALANQLAASPVVDQVKRIVRRASVQFQKELKHLQNARRQGRESVEEDTEIGRRSRRIVKDLIALGKDTGYLDPIKEALKKL